MTANKHCVNCSAEALTPIYGVEAIPVFQNKVYDRADQAREAVSGSVNLVACGACGFVFNAEFDASLMSYDSQYQNEQSHSPVFDDYLDTVVSLLKSRGYGNRKIVEIGCGKGTFLGKLWQQGFDAIGFDTAYEGADPRVHREYFSASHQGIAMDLLVLRHTLEHIASPLAFLQHLASLCPPRTRIYIEVPSLEWIMEKRAFWDVFYEHCNYFTMESLCGLFRQADSGFLFGGQYMFAIASLDDLLSHPAARPDAGELPLFALQEEIAGIRNFVQQHPGMLIWGAGAKGATFVNILDPQQQWIRAVVDINPKKAGRFVAGTGHPVITPVQIAQTGATDVLIMNENYRQEIMSMASGAGLRFHTLGLDDLGKARR